MNAANPLEVAEDGSATCTVVLDSRPTHAVTVTAASGDGARVSVSPRTHNFTPSAWNTPLTFTVREVADDESVAIGHGVISADTQYAAVLVNSVKVAVADTTEGRQQANQAPTVASAIGDAAIVNGSGTRQVSLSRVFSDADNDSPTVTAGSSNDAVATASLSAGYSSLTVNAKSRGPATVTVAAAGSRVSDAFEVVVVKKYAALIAQVYEWRNDPNGVHDKSHTDRWDRALLAFGETVVDASLTPMTAAEAREMAGKHMASRWNPVAEALAEIEAGWSG